MNRRSRERLQSHFVSIHTQAEVPALKDEQVQKAQKTVLETFQVEKAPHLVLPLYLSEKNEQI